MTPNLDSSPSPIYPIIYYISKQRSFSFIILGGLLNFICLPILIIFTLMLPSAIHEEAGSFAKYIAMILLLCVIIYLGLYMIFNARKPRVILYIDAIEIYTLFGRKRINCSEIKYFMPASPYELILKNSVKKIYLPIELIINDFFFEWLKQFPNLQTINLQLKENAKMHLLQEPNGGSTAEVRKNVNKIRSKIVTGLNNTIICLGVFTLVANYFSMVPIATFVWMWIMVPFIVLSLHIYWKRYATLFGFSPRDARPNFSASLLTASITLGIVASPDSYIVSVMPVFNYAIAAGTCIYLIILFLEPEIRLFNKTSLALILCCIFYSYGALYSMDVMLDSRPIIESSTARIYGKTHTANGQSRAITLYYLKMALDKNPEDIREVKVSRAFYYSINIGQQVCNYLHRGALNIPWYNIQPCE